MHVQCLYQILVKNVKVPFVEIVPSAAPPTPPLPPSYMQCKNLLNLDIFIQLEAKVLEREE